MADIRRTVTLTDRKRLEMCGVKEVISFYEGGASLITENGELSVEGESIRIENLDVEKGEIEITGKIDAIIYSDESVGKKKGLRSRLFG